MTFSKELDRFSLHFLNLPANPKLQGGRPVRSGLPPQCQVTKRKVSAGTRSDIGRDCRDAFLGLAKTCAKLGITFWDYLGSRLHVPNHPAIPHLPQIIRHRCATAQLCRALPSCSLNS